MTYRTGDAPLSINFGVNISEPLDAKNQSVSTFSELATTPFKYKGLHRLVEDEGENGVVYVLGEDLITWTSTASGGVNTFSNGLTETENAVKLGGTLSEDAVIDGDTVNSFVVVNTDQYVVNDAHGSVFVLDDSGVTLVDGISGNSLTMTDFALQLQSVGGNSISLSTDGISITDNVNSQGIYMTAANLVMADSANNNVILNADGINLSSSDKVVVNTSTTLDGASYGANYALANVGNPRWITDKEYVDSKTSIGTSVKTPTSTGISGQVSYNSGFKYTCVATNVWVREVVDTSW